MKYKIKHSYYDKNTGCSEVAIECKYGRFMGFAYLNPKDKEYESTFFGCAIAENRAYVEALKYRVHLLEVEIQTLTRLEKLYESANYTDYDSREWILLTKQLRIKSEEKEELVELINTIKDAVDKHVDSRIKLIDKKFRR